METKLTKKLQPYYQRIADHLENRSEEICKDNNCTEDQHNCNSFAYFDYDKEIELYTLQTICISDYCQRVYDSLIGLPFSGNAFDLFNELEDNLIEEY